MKREDVKKLLENGVLHAFAEGRTVQVFSSCSQEWLDIRGEEGVFPLPAERYRVKPEQLHDWVVCIEENGCFIRHNKTASYMKYTYGEEKAYSYRRLVPVTEE